MFRMMKEKQTFLWMFSLSTLSCWWMFHRAREIVGCFCVCGFRLWSNHKTQNGMARVPNINRKRLQFFHRWTLTNALRTILIICHSLTRIEDVFSHALSWFSFMEVELCICVTSQAQQLVTECAAQGNASRQKDANFQPFNEGLLFAWTERLVKFILYRKFRL